jgi:hypothetical protein
MTELSEAYIQPTVLNRAQMLELMSKYEIADKPLDPSKSHFGRRDGKIMDQSWSNGGLVGQSKRMPTGYMSDARKLYMRNTVEGRGLTHVKSAHVVLCCDTEDTHSIITDRVSFYFGDKENGKKEDDDNLSRPKMVCTPFTM